VLKAARCFGRSHCFRSITDIPGVLRIHINRFPRKSFITPIIPWAPSAPALQRSPGALTWRCHGGNQVSLLRRGGTPRLGAGGPCCGQRCLGAGLVLGDLGNKHQHYPESVWPLTPLRDAESPRLREPSCPAFLPRRAGSPQASTARTRTRVLSPWTLLPLLNWHLPARVPEPPALEELREGWLVNMRT